MPAAETDDRVAAPAAAGPGTAEQPLPTGGSGAVPVAASGAPEGPRLSYGEARARLLADFELRYLTDLLAATKGNLSEASRRSGIDRSNLRRMLKRRGLRAKAFRSQLGGES